MSGYLGRRIVSERVHYTAHLGKPLLTLECIAELLVGIEPKFRFNRIQGIDKCHTLIFIVARHFAYQHGRCDGILVAQLRNRDAATVQVALLADRDQLLGEAARLFGLDQRRLNLAVGERLLTMLASIARR